VETAVLEEDGSWTWRGERQSELTALQALRRERDTTVFLALHGGRGEDGRIQALLESAQVRYTGSGPAASSLCMDKRAARGVLVDEGLRVPPAQLVSQLPADADSRARLQQALAELSGEEAGWFVKPNLGGSSAGIQRVQSADGLLAAVSLILELGDRALVEAAILGTELSVGVLGIEGVDLRALPPVEIRPRSAGWFDAVEKYDVERGAIEVCPPQSVSPKVDERLREQALRAHTATGCRCYSRTDFIVTAEDEIVALEVNTLPGLTARSLLPLEALCAGMDFESLCLEILRLAGP
jgi:D-alanine-D-alanine ligase